MKIITLMAVYSWILEMMTSSATQDLGNHSCRLQNSRFSTFSEGGKRRKRDRVSLTRPRSLAPDLYAFEYGPSLTFAKSTAVLQSIILHALTRTARMSSLLMGC